MSDDKAHPVLRDSMDRRGADDPENSYIQWRDDYLTQVDSDFEHFRRANEGSRTAALAERDSLGARAPSNNNGPLEQPLAAGWTVVSVPTADLASIRREGLKLGDYPSHLPYLHFFVVAVANFQLTGECGDLIPAHLLRVKSQAVAQFEETHNEDPALWPLLGQTEDENVHWYNREGVDLST